MTQNRLELKILADSTNHGVQLADMSLHAGKAFKVFLESLIQIVEHTPGHENIKLQITTGSAVVAAFGPVDEIKLIKDNFDTVSSFKSTNDELVRPWREIQKLVSANGLQYEANFFIQGESVTSITPNLKEKKLFKVKTVKQRPEIEIYFHHGRLMAVGGQHPNFHVQLNSGEQIKVSCSEVDARRVNSFLYNTLYFSVWSREIGGVITSNQFCDVYINEESFNFVNGLFSKVQYDSPDETILRNIYQVTHEIIGAKDFPNLAKFLRLFNHKGIDVNYLKTLLVITKGIKNQENIASIRAKIEETLESQVEVF